MPSSADTARHETSALWPVSIALGVTFSQPHIKHSSKVSITQTTNIDVVASGNRKDTWHQRTTAALQQCLEFTFGTGLT